MFFWILLYFIYILIFFSASIFLSEKNKKYTAILLLSILTFFSAFRYGIGVDYFSYETLYYSDFTYKEPFFDFVISILRSVGFSSQMMFFVYACLTSFCYWQAITSYFSKAQHYLLSVMLYAVIDTLWLFSMNGMRQGLSVVLIFWAVSFLFKKQFKKFILLWIFAVLGHYAAIITLIMIAFYKINIRKPIHIIIMIFGFFLGTYVNLGDALIPILYWCNDVFGIGIKYVNYLTLLTQDSIVREGGTGLGIIFTVIISILIILFLDKKIELNNFICNMLTVAIVIKSFFWFSEAFIRLRGFFEIFLVLGIVVGLERFSIKHRVYLALVLILIYSIMELNYLNGLSKDYEITYIMNFNLLD